MSCSFGEARYKDKIIQELRAADNETTTSERLGLESFALDDSL